MSSDDECRELQRQIDNLESRVDALSDKLDAVADRIESLQSYLYRKEENV